ncbi:MAG: hypothetical protein KDF58_05745 [Alphaproteobacteria bacterium]|nr:hypothetical protein [Alphaproteobacteria bacterium]
MIYSSPALLLHHFKYLFGAFVVVKRFFFLRRDIDAALAGGALIDFMTSSRIFYYPVKLNRL